MSRDARVQGAVEMVRSDSPLTGKHFGRGSQAPQTIRPRERSAPRGAVSRADQKEDKHADGP